MAIVGDIVTYVMMAFVLIGAVASLFDSEAGMGKEFKDGIYSLGPIFVPVAGVMASLPYLSWFVEHVLGHLWTVLGASPSMAATTVIASDMGGYQLAEATASSHADWITASVTGFMAGATIVYTIPVGLATIAVKDRKYLALGIMSGVLTVPIGVFTTMAIVLMTDTPARGNVSTHGPADVHLTGLSWPSLLLNLVPLAVIMVILGAALYLFTNAMVRGFIRFGRIMTGAMFIVLAVSIVDHVTGLLSENIAWWNFKPIIATSGNTMQALEVVGNIAIMLAGAFPFVYAIKRYCSKPLTLVGRWLRISPEGIAGLLAASANMIAAFHLIKDMHAKDKVVVIAFGTCSAFLLGDHLAFTANFQPTLIGPLLIGKFIAGAMAMGIAGLIAVPAAKRHERAEPAPMQHDVSAPQANPESEVANSAGATHRAGHAE